MRNATGLHEGPAGHEKCAAPLTSGLKIDAAQWYRMDDSGENEMGDI